MDTACMVSTQHVTCHVWSRCIMSYHLLASSTPPIYSLVQVDAYSRTVVSRSHHVCIQSTSSLCPLLHHPAHYTIIHNTVGILPIPYDFALLYMAKLMHESYPLLYQKPAVSSYSNSTCHHRSTWHSFAMLTTSSRESWPSGDVVRHVARTQ